MFLPCWGLNARLTDARPAFYWAIPLALRKNSLNQTKSKWFFCLGIHMKKHIWGRYMTRLSYQTDLPRGPGESLQPPPKKTHKRCCTACNEEPGYPDLELSGPFTVGKVFFLIFPAAMISHRPCRRTAWGPHESATSNRHAISPAVRLRSQGVWLGDSLHLPAPKDPWKNRNFGNEVLNLLVS